MRVLLDENLNWRLARCLPGHDVESVQLNGWAGLKNGELLQRAAKRFDVFVAMDGNIQFQQNYPALDLAIVILRTPTNRLSDTEPLMTRLIEVLPTLHPGSFTVLSTA